jgi:hypothetical protein
MRAERTGDAMGYALHDAGRDRLFAAIIERLRLYWL